MNSMFMIVGLGGLGAVALLAFLVEANVIPEKHLRTLGVGIFGAMAVTIGALVLIEDDAEFSYGNTSFEMKKKESGGDGGGMTTSDDSGGGGPGDDAAGNGGGGDDMAGGDGGGGSGEGGGPVGFRAETEKASNQDCAECPAMVPVAAGSATIGSFMDVIAADATSAPQIEVELPRSFAISQLEISRDQYAAFVADTGYATPTTCMKYGVSQPAPAYKSEEATTDGTRPATCLRFEDAEAYTRWLTKKAGRAYRLPSEAEWEYVAAANVGDTKINRAVPQQHRGMVGEVAALFSGAAEWTRDCAADEIKVAGNDAGINLTANILGCSARITKGGSDSSSIEARAPGMRGRIAPGTVSADIGFRVLRESVEQM